jgi:hypothetical protein
MKPRIRWAVAFPKMRMLIKKWKRELAASCHTWLPGIALRERAAALIIEPDWQLVVQYRQDAAASTPAVVSSTSHTEAEGSTILLALFV